MFSSSESGGADRVEKELEETEVPVGGGCDFAVLGAHDPAKEELVTSVRGRSESELSRR